MKKYIAILLLTLLTVAGFAQSVPSYNAIKLIGSDSTSSSVTVNGTLRVDAVTGALRLRRSGTWTGVGSGGGGGGGLTDGNYGDWTVSSGGTVATINAAAITYAKFQNLTGLSIFGRSTNSDGVGASITAGSNGNILYRNGTSLTFGSPPGTCIANTPAGSIAATDVQTAINELDTEKAPYRQFTLSGVFTNQPAYSASEGYYLMYPEVSTVIPRFYMSPNNPGTNGTKWKFEGFHTDYLSGSTNYAGFNLFGQTISGVHYTWMGPNTGGSGTRGLFVLGSFAGSAQEANTSELRMNTNNTWNVRGNGITYEALNGTDWFGINSSGAYLVQGSAGNANDVLISNGSSGPPSWGVTSGNLNSTTTSTAGSTITLDMNSQVQRIHVASASISGPKTIAMSNTTNALVFAFTIQITDVAGVLTMPANWVMSSVNFNGTDWTPPSTGFFKFAGTYDGANWFVNVAGPYQ